MIATMSWATMRIKMAFSLAIFHPLSFYPSFQSLVRGRDLTVHIMPSESTHSTLFGVGVEQSGSYAHSFVFPTP
jgi:hypothetical protein